MKTVYLENTSGHSKFYRMTQISATEWIAEYGKIGSTSIKHTYSINEWDKKYNEKIKKGYVEKSNTTTIKSSNTIPKQDPILDKLNLLYELIEKTVLIKQESINNKEKHLKKVKNVIFKHTNLDSLSREELLEMNEIYKIYYKK